ncbi:MAG: hypothetical protein ACRCUT_02310, partial [Spirochaetota bacterium]
TSSYHLSRALDLFRMEKIDAAGYPSGMLGEIRGAHWNDFLPAANSLRNSSLAMKECAAKTAARAMLR